MKTVRILLNVVVLVYVAFLILLLSGLLDAATFFNLSAQTEVVTVYKVLLAISGVLLLLKLIISNVSVAHKKHDLHRASVKINELKAELYDERQAYRSSQAKQAQSEMAERQENNLY